jgi:hypothetical protein
LIRADDGECLTLARLGDDLVLGTGLCGFGFEQRFTLAADGTLRVGGRCVRATADDEIRFGECADRSTEQWRAGRSASLVNRATNRCLDGSLTITRTRACDGGDEQRWKLP